MKCSWTLPTKAMSSSDNHLKGTLAHFLGKGEHDKALERFNKTIMMIRPSRMEGAEGQVWTLTHSVRGWLFPGDTVPMGAQ
ncbi:hypothetical protein GMLC_05490 [Geomonas limicola]|uniref:Uncharacterized protein n=1 Tax=Geomonas limicola TaxID=2740186 RepID=A0A6V8N3N3_9BACT|nr:hypothetical protein GMLC_05490 [Geomonas limicola]